MWKAYWNSYDFVMKLNTIGLRIGSRQFYLKLHVIPFDRYYKRNNFITRSQQMYLHNWTPTSLKDIGCQCNACHGAFPQQFKGDLQSVCKQSLCLHFCVQNIELYSTTIYIFKLLEYNKWSRNNNQAFQELKT